MVRKLATVSLAVFLVLAFAAMASAAFDVASTSKKGSLLVFPKVINVGAEGAETTQTYIFIGNDATTNTYVKCYWMDENQSIEDFEFVITANQPIVFSTASNDYGPTLGPNRAGALTCWAEKLSSTGDYLQFQAFDHLYGYAMIHSAVADVFYNAYSFAMFGATAAKDLAAQGFCTADTCNLLINGLTQPTIAAGLDACPKYLVTNFVTGWDDNATPAPLLGNYRADLALWPCKQDLRQDRKPTCTKAKFDVWNGHEVKFTGAYQCFKCYFEGILEDIGTTPGYTNGGAKYGGLIGKGPAFGADKFWGSRLKTHVARLRVQGIASSVCDGYDPGGSKVTELKTKGCYWTDPATGTTSPVKSVASPLLGVLTYALSPISASQPFAPKAGYTLFGAGYDLTGDRKSVV